MCMMILLAIASAACFGTANVSQIHIDTDQPEWRHVSEISVKGEDVFLAEHLKNELMRANVPFLVDYDLGPNFLIPSGEYARLQEFTDAEHKRYGVSLRHGVIHYNPMSAHLRVSSRTIARFSPSAIKRMLMTRIQIHKLGRIVGVSVTARRFLVSPVSSSVGYDILVRGSKDSCRIQWSKQLGVCVPLSDLLRLGGAPFRKKLRLSRNGAP